MQLLLNRYRNLTVLLVVIAAQIMLIAYQVKANKDVPIVRVWAVSAVTPIERGLELARRNTWGFVEDYIALLHTRSENGRLLEEIGRLKLHNLYLQTELSTADRARALSVFQARSPSKTLAARIIGNGTGANSKAVFVDRGSGSGIEAGMAAVTPDGIVGKVLSAYPTASLVLLITDSNFAAGVISQKNRVHGTLKGRGHDGTVLVDYIQNEEKIDSGEWFYTSGDDRIFPKGFPVGQVTAVRNGRTVKEIYVTPSGFQNGVDELLIILDAVHQEIPDVQMASAAYKLLQAPPQVSDPAVPGFPKHSTAATEADRLKEQYRQVGVAEKHTFGEGAPGSPPPDFTKMGRPVATDAAANGALPSKPNQTTAPVTTSTPAIPAPNRDRDQPAPIGTAPAPGAKHGLSAGAARNGVPAEVPNIPAQPKSRSSGPLLITDPTDADPSEPVTPPASSRPEKAARPRESVDGSTEILPPTPPPRSTKTTNSKSTKSNPPQ